MQFEIEPYGVNDAFLRLKRNGAGCVLTYGGGWNGLVRLNYLVAPSLAKGDPHAIFRAADVGWDGDRFRRRGRAAPLLVDTAMVEHLCERGLVGENEVGRLLASPAPPDRPEGDHALMLRAALGGCTFQPVYGTDPHAADGDPPQVTGFAMRTLTEREAYMLEARNGLPVLDARSRSALLRQFPGP
ncbi:hypothetical protein [Arenibaculum pallidiluteum]|uniref:hypothetical protein n=1 Tax=Arenibaculum pallidiluteum TaxID=2812559 RepID=UPI001A95EE88|nr:hypothetical protein [Arenibaculum pallidiluteum]